MAAAGQLLPFTGRHGAANRYRLGAWTVASGRASSDSGTLPGAPQPLEHVRTDSNAAVACGTDPGQLVALSHSLHPDHAGLFFSRIRGFVPTHRTASRASAPPIHSPCSPWSSCAIMRLCLRTTCISRQQTPCSQDLSTHLRPRSLAERPTRNGPSIRVLWGTNKLSRSALSQGGGRSYASNAEEHRLDASPSNPLPARLSCPYAGVA